ncbi:three-helix bundle dimerization domain-containing protein [Amnibacterium kyonggiense]|uniref:Uncharacterized protein n=1 Tax=Amnibacterium kyonggiense TaxID=595671 RepID=A0A4R7FRF2_9MICO|nr:hypothetical protein [Amnibacterium kyonggiense]TDS80288.1 hypothetical protein CLV52_0845 [Amnibacterium kyonggiense]
MAESFDAEQVVREVTTTLLTKFPDRDPVEVERAVREQVDELARHPVRDYVSVLARRAAKKQLESNA